MLKKIIVGSVALAIIQGCSFSKDVETHQKISDIKIRNTTTDIFLSDLPAIPENKLYKFLNPNDRNPFSEKTIEVLNVEEIKDELVEIEKIEKLQQRNRQFLESFALSDLVFAGTIKKTGSDELQALFYTPNKNIHTVSVEDYIGKNHGRIIQINNGEVVIEESFIVNNRIATQIRFLNK